VRCILIYNPAAGRNRALRTSEVERVAAALSADGHSVDVACTTGPGSAAHQACEAAARADVIFACGGDGTVHEVLQGLVTETGTPACTLGIIPLGSANALARHLRISLDPVTAAIQQLRGKPGTVPVGKVVSGGVVRYFAFMAGAGPDGALVHSLQVEHKAHLGRVAYYARAASLFFTLSFPAFEVDFVLAGSDSRVTSKAVSVMATRIGNLGGLFRGLTDPHASIKDSALHVHLLSPPAVVSLPLWFLCGWFGLRRLNPFFECVAADSLSCRPAQGPAPDVQADGEWIGQLPIQVSVVPHALRILSPGNQSEL
jgi:diacylglycerol kinase family enzyme